MMFDSSWRVIQPEAVAQKCCCSQ